MESRNSCSLRFSMLMGRRLDVRLEVDPQLRYPRCFCMLIEATSVPGTFLFVRGFNKRAEGSG